MLIVFLDRINNYGNVERDGQKNIRIHGVKKKNKRIVNFITIAKINKKYEIV